MKKTSNRVVVYLNDESLERLDTYADGLGESRSGVVRAALRAFYKSKDYLRLQLHGSSTTSPSFDTFSDAQ